jgi:ABC-type multidrug transport system fused ATPase/permease subunit
VGASGSGKTTIAHLLLRFVQPDSGRIMVDGADLAAIPVQNWRKQLAWVSQSAYLFNTTVAENIRFSNANASEAEVVAAAQAAYAHDFIMQLPDGYQTLCGERGIRLSGGQAQRIALARAFLRHAPLLILDEPTSQLDPESEAEIMQALFPLVQGRTMLLITHRLDTVRDADQIIVMDGGRIVEQGNYAELSAAGGYFVSLLESNGNGAGED